MKITNNMGAKLECDIKVVEVLEKIYTTNEYKMVKGDYDDAEDYIITHWLALWEMFWGKLTPMKNLNILEEITN